MTGQLPEARFEREITIDASPSVVWRFLTTAELVAEWYAFDGAVIEAEPGGRLEFHWNEHGTFRGTVVTAAPPRRFSYRIAALPDVDPNETNSTLVTFSLETAGDGCRLVIVQSGFDFLEGNAATASSPEIESGGWFSALAALQARAEKARPQ